jgi:N-acyl-L-homoserine lactone synthetase
MSVEPLRWAMKEGAKRIILVRNVEISKPLKWDSVSVHRLQSKNGYLDINDRLGSQAGCRNDL